jgi:hypothetical protein
MVMSVSLLLVPTRMDGRDRARVTTFRRDVFCKT